MTPYYSEDGITLYHGDCREILPTFPDKSFDLVLTDPPYGINYQSARRIERKRKSVIVGDDSFPMWVFDELRPRIAMFLWCRWDMLSAMPTPKSLIVWDKEIHSMGDLHHEFGRRWEACAFYPGPEHKFKYRPVDIIRAQRVHPDKLQHPAEKPLGAIRPLIDCHDTESILDPFCGSGTTLVAAKQLGRKAVGIEIEEKYCEIAVKRLAQMELFQ